MEQLGCNSFSSGGSEDCGRPNLERDVFTTNRERLLVVADIGDAFFETLLKAGSHSQSALG